MLGVWPLASGGAEVRKSAGEAGVAREIDHPWLAHFLMATPKSRKKSPASPKRAPKSPAPRRSAPPSVRSLGAVPDLDSRVLLLEAAAKVGDAEITAVIRGSKEIEEKAGRGLLTPFLNHVRDLLALVTDYSRGRYRAIPLGSIAVIAGALGYLLSPMDLIPDFIPGLGLVDDAGVIGACLKIVRPQLERYKAARRS